MTPSASAEPRTPSPSRPSTRGLVDSPFSDYYTDSSAFSPDPPPQFAQFASPAQRKLLTRLNRIGTQILKRTQSEDANSVLSRELDILESAVGAPIPRTREGDDVVDSALFMDEDDGDIESSDDEEEEGQEQGQGGQEEMTESRNGLGARMSSSPESELLDSPVEEQQHQEELEHDMSGKVVMDAEDAHALVARVTKVASELRERFEETKHMNDLMVTKMETASNEVLHLRSENEALRADLSFDHSELLFLKLQLKAVELAIDAHADGDKQFTNNLSKSLTDGIEKWKSDWQDVDLKFKARRAKYGMTEPPEEQTSPSPKTFDEDGHIKMPEVMKAKMPKKILSITRPHNTRSFTAPPPMQNQPPTPPLTARDGESNGDEDEQAAILESQKALDSDAITTSDEEEEDDMDDLSDGDEEEEEENDEDEDGDDDDDDDEASVDEEEDVDELEAAAPEKTPFQELWDSLTEFVGMARGDDDDDD
ncbi:hypothetical protein NA57DRAFT_56033 [Rhizodiscina lignyota]|uniref:Uncharacterized protein n=1 Tax=Rhizodiscina lignyota TaxID=1504668 RepID=A0A9P4MA77_9PEZI|nr:hypothetical protein NA57DRAFT_56033 [Rhizodiscina lignyota]